MASKISDEPRAWKIDHPRFGNGCVINVEKYGHSRAILFTRNFYTRINKKDLPDYRGMRVSNDNDCGLNPEQIQALVDLVNPPAPTASIQQSKKNTPKQQRRLISVNRPRRFDGEPQYQVNDSLLFKSPFFAPTIDDKDSITLTHIKQQGVLLLNREPRKKRKDEQVVFGDRRGVILEVGYFDNNNNTYSKKHNGSDVRMYKVRFDLDDAKKKDLRARLPTIFAQDIDDNEYVIDPRQAE